MTRTRNALLDAMRGGAALAVVVDHIRSFLFVNSDVLLHTTITTKILYYFTGFGRQAVMIFFVLSGYLVGGSVVKSASASFWGTYLLQRLSRLWVVLIPCLALTLLWDRIGLHTGGLQYLNGDLNPPVSTAPNIPVTVGWSAFAGNAFFLQTILVPVFGDNMPLWSLANEFWYYILFPLMFIGLRHNNEYSWAARLGFIGCSVYIIYWLPIAVTIGYIVWLLGVGIAFIERKWPLHWSNGYLPRFVLTGAFVVVMHLARVRIITGAFKDLWIGIGVAGLLLVIVQARWLVGTWSVVANRLSEFSYTIYLAHFPFLSFIWYTFLLRRRMQPSLVGEIYALAVFLVLIAYSYMVYLVFERRTPDIRRVVGRWLHIL